MRQLITERLRSAPRRRLRSDYDLYEADALPERLPPAPRRAAVLVPLVIREPGLTVLLTRRAEHLPHHPGQVSFPGGRAEPHDRDAAATALREAQEEIGLPASQVELIGRLDSYETVTGFKIVPVVGFVTPPLVLKPDPEEVADIFEVPLDFIIDPANHRRESRLFKGQVRHFYVLPYNDFHIWGATAHMLVNLSEVLRHDARGEELG